MSKRTVKHHSNSTFRIGSKSELLDAFEQGMDLREEADYSMIYSYENAQELIESAQQFLSETKRLLRIEA